MCTKGSRLIFVPFPETFHSAFLPVRKVPCWFSSGFQKLSIQSFFLYERFHADFRPVPETFHSAFLSVRKVPCWFSFGFGKLSIQAFVLITGKKELVVIKTGIGRKKVKKFSSVRGRNWTRDFFVQSSDATSMTILTCLLWWTKSFTLFFFIAFFLQYHS